MLWSDIIDTGLLASRGLSKGEARVLRVITLLDKPVAKVQLVRHNGFTVGNEFVVRLDYAQRATCLYRDTLTTSERREEGFMRGNELVKARFGSSSNLIARSARADVY